MFGSTNIRRRMTDTHLPQDGKESLVNDAVLGDVVDGADDGARRRPRPAETRRPEPLGVDADETPTSVVVDERRDDEPRQPRRLHADVPTVLAVAAAAAAGRSQLLDARTTHVDDHSPVSYTHLTLPTILRV